jgi:hypothetical protein
MGGWRLWSLAQPGEKPVVVDGGVGGELPFFSISGDSLVWATAHGKPLQSQLLLEDLTSMTRRVLLSDAPGRTQYWFPAIDGDRIVYGTVELSPDGSSDERHVYLLDLGGSAQPRRLDHGTSVSEPVIRGDDVVWKESDPKANFLIPGKLVHYALETGQESPIDLPTIGDLGFTDPTIGNNFVAAWEQSLREVYLYDLRNGSYVKIVDLGPSQSDPEDTAARADISGDLLTYVFGPATGDLELRWILLR